MSRFVLFVMLMFAIAFGGCHHSSSGGGGGGGGGGDDDPVIQTVEDLKNISPDECTEDFTLVNDIVVDEAWEGLCLGGFSGKFYGDGHTITFNGALNGGLFAYIGDGGEVYDLGIVANGGVSGVDIGGSAFAGALAGYADDNTIIDNCSATVEGSVTADGTNAFAGGLVGYSESSIDKSYATVSDNITATASGGQAAAGGLAGDVEGGVNDAFAYVGGGIYATAGSVDPGTDYATAGGLLGYGYETSNSFAIVGGNIVADSPVYAASGGIVAQVDFSLNSSFTIVKGDIIAQGQGDSDAGGAAGTLAESTTTVGKCVMVLGGDISADNTGDAVGYAATSPTSDANYIYRADDNCDGQATEITANDLNEMAWWTSIGYTDTAWSLSDGKVPMQAEYPDLPQYTWPDWVQ